MKHDALKKLRKMKIWTGPCSNMEEVNTALELVSKSFGPNYYEANKKFTHFFTLEKILTPRNIIIVKGDEDILGVLPILERKINLFDKKVEIVGVTGVCVHPDYQGMGFGKILLNKAIVEFKGRSGVLSILFARRAVDGFYEKFGYVGTSYFAEMTIKKDIYINNTEIKDLRIKTGEIRRNRHEYMRMYTETYKEIPFSFYRDYDWWKNISGWLQYKIDPEGFFNISYRGKLIGYFMCKERKVIEAACNSSAIEVFCNALLFFARKNNFSELVLNIPKKHPCLEYFAKINHILKLRRAWDGGHMTRIINKDKFSELIINYIRARYAGVFNAEIVRGSINYIVEVLQKLDESDHKEANRALFEIINNKSTPILREVGNMFEHNWSIIDEF